MSSYRNNNAFQCLYLPFVAERLCVVTAFFLFLVFTAHAQIYIPPNTAGGSNEPKPLEETLSLGQNTEPSVGDGGTPSGTPLTLNEYASRYKEVPKEVATSIVWYASPQKIASRIPLGEIEVYVRRLEDDTPYLEKTHNKKKGRIFLKETRGPLYRIYDVVFVPYIPLESPKKPAEESVSGSVSGPSAATPRAQTQALRNTPPSETETETDTDKQSKIERSSTGGVVPQATELVQEAAQAKDTKQAETAVGQEGAQKTSQGAQDKKSEETQTGTEIEEGEEGATPEKKEEEVKTRVPTYEERHTGKSLFVEIKKFRSDGSVDILVRYTGDVMLFSETYQYTSKGALRTLTRKYSDKSLVRFVYYFSGGGLEEEFHQNADSSVYYKKYTPEGQLKESARYNSEAVLEYKITYGFAKDGSIEREEEITPEGRSYTSYKNGKKHETVRYEKNETENSEEKESVVSRVRYGYGSGENTSSGENEKFLHEKSSESFFDEKGVLVKKREYVDFELTKEIEYGEEEERIETHFFKEKAVLKIHYVGARKERVEVLK